MGKDRQSYQRIELEKVYPTIGYLLEVANALKIPFKELFSFIDEE
jgi:transcriptional regulator with XRE-family HTH domain